MAVCMALSLSLSLSPISLSWLSSVPSRGQRGVERGLILSNADITGRDADHSPTLAAPHASSDPGIALAVCVRRKGTVGHTLGQCRAWRSRGADDKDSSPRCTALRWRKSQGRSQPRAPQPAAIVVRCRRSTSGRRDEELTMNQGPS
eukprot:415870-Rhodomonas_salina.1